MYNRYQITEPGQATRQNEGLLLNVSKLMKNIYGLFGQRDYYGEIAQFEFEILDISSCRAYNFDPCVPSSSKKNVDDSIVSSFQLKDMKEHFI
jgi:hypothetical protein